MSLPPLHVTAVDRPELRADPLDPTTLPTDRLELYFVIKKEFKHLMLLVYEMIGSSGGARDAAPIVAQAARRFAIAAQAFADADPAEPKARTVNGAV